MNCLIIIINNLRGGLSDVSAKTATLLLQGCYLGHPNLSRCRAGDTAHCTYIRMGDVGTPFQAPAPFCPPDAVMYSPTCGLIEYRSYAFGGVYDGDVFVSGYLQQSYHYFTQSKRVLGDTEDSLYPSSLGVGMTQAPGGVHVYADFANGKILFNRPSDPDLLKNNNPSLYDIMPMKAACTQTGPNTFIIGGENFNHIKGTAPVHNCQPMYRACRQ